jgi:hypothetical protein
MDSFRSMTVKFGQISVSRETNKAGRIARIARFTEEGKSRGK